jgi:ABC-2 type transport system ATP-binding protein/lipopolysaccharide transport system ATP-binding protein
MPSITLERASVTIPIYNARSRALKSELLRRAVGANFTDARDPGVVAVRAVDNVTLRVNHGDRIALIGRNGSGKTTLLRLMAGIYPPTSGRVTISGNVSSLTDLSLGMDPESTGYENIILRGLVLGMTRREATAMIPDIEEFTELGEYLGLPIRTYSAGMTLRLAFAVSTAVKPDIIILDEMISAGDASFILKAKVRIEQLIERASIMVLASHDESLVARLCPKAVWMDAGRMMAAGETAEVIRNYKESIGQPA